MVRHTPGPWHVSGFSDDIRAADEVLVGSAWLVDNDEERKQANARLIAAAPELLAACEVLVEEATGPNGPEPTTWTQMIAKQAREIIMKARGEK